MHDDRSSPVTDTELKPCPLCASTWVGRWAVGRTVQCNSCGCAADLRAWNARPLIHAQCAPDGWQLVPIEPTREMLHASTMQVPTWDNDASRRKWQAMLNAAPALTSTDGGEVLK